MSTNIKIIIFIVICLTSISIFHRFGFIGNLPQPQNKIVMKTYSTQAFNQSIKDINNQLGFNRGLHFRQILWHHIIQLNIENQCDENRVWQAFTDDIAEKNGMEILFEYGKIYPLSDKVSINMHSIEQACPNVTSFLILDFSLTKLAEWKITKN